VTGRFRALLATAGRNWALLWLWSGKSCEDCPVWGALLFNKSKQRPPVRWP